MAETFLAELAPALLAACVVSALLCVGLLLLIWLGGRRLEARLEAMGEAQAKRGAALREALAGLAEAAASLREGSADSSRALTQALDEQREVLGKAEAAQRELAKQAEAELKTLATALGTPLGAGAKSFEAVGEALAAVSERLDESSRKLEGQFDAFDREMQTEVTRATTLMGRQLAGIIDHLVEGQVDLREAVAQLGNDGALGEATE